MDALWTSQAHADKSYAVVVVSERPDGPHVDEVSRPLKPGMAASQQVYYKRKWQDIHHETDGAPVTVDVVEVTLELLP